MGLEVERGISPSGEALKDSLLHPALSSAGLSRFEARLPHFSAPSFKELAFRVGSSLLTLTGIASMNPPDFSPLSLTTRTAFRTALAQSAVPLESSVDTVQEQMLSDTVTRWNTLAIKEEALGESFELTGSPLSKVFTDSSGYSKLYQTVLVSLSPAGQAFPRYVLTEMEQNNNFDAYHVPSFLGDAAPKKGEFRVNPSEQITQKVAALGRVFGLPNLQITGSDQFAGYNSFRIGDNNGDIGGLVEYGDGTIRMAHFAPLASQAGIVPQDMMLAYGETATGGGTTPTPEQTAQLETGYPTDFPERFGDLKKDGVEFINKGKKSGLAPGDQELYQNLLWIKTNYAPYPDIPRKVFTYDSAEQLLRTISTSPGNYTSYPWQWGVWSKLVPMFDQNDQPLKDLAVFPPAFKDGIFASRVLPDGTQEFHFSLPEAIDGYQPEQAQLDFASIPQAGERLPILRIIFTKEDGVTRSSDAILKFSQDQMKNYPDLGQLRLFKRIPNGTNFPTYILPFYIVYK